MQVNQKRPHLNQTDIENLMQNTVNLVKKKGKLISKTKYI